MDERAIEELRALEKRDTVLQGRAARLRELDERVTAIRAGAEELDGFIATYPAEVDRLNAVTSRLQADVAARRDEAAEAERAEQKAADEESQLLARRARERADEHVADTELGLARARAELAELDARAEAAPRELADLHTRAAEVHAEAPETPSPDAAESLVDWASHARAELFVAAGHVDTQRERSVREANELASMLLGEPTYGSTVAQALARVESAAATTALQDTPPSPTRIER